MEKITIQLEELVCPACVTKIEAALKMVEGVYQAEAFFNSSKSKIVFDPEKTNKEALVELISSLGYDVISCK